MGKASGLLGVAIIGILVWFLISFLPNVLDATVEVAEANAQIAQAEAISDVAHIAQIQAGTSAIVSTGMIFMLVIFAMMILFSVISSKRSQPQQQVYLNAQGNQRGKWKGRNVGKQFEQTYYPELDTWAGPEDQEKFKGYYPDNVECRDDEPVANTGYYGEGY